MKIARERKEGRISQIRDQEIRESYKDVNIGHAKRLHKWSST